LHPNLEKGMKTPKQALFQVSLKILLRSGQKVLLTRGSKKDIDLPGGRIDVGEENAAFEDVIAREIREELGADVRFHLGAVLFVHHLGYTKNEGSILNVVFEAQYISGDIKLSEEHISYEWVDRRLYQFSKQDFLLQDQKKYKAFKQYFSRFQGK
jgi:8-oxo-dGTP pyrophosphatase MutT (NUDIX family)